MKEPIPVPRVPMTAFVEILSVIVRVGPGCDKYGDPFEFAVAVSSVDGKTAVVKALVAEGSQHQFTVAHSKAIIRALKRTLIPFKACTWERIHSEPDALEVPVCHVE